MVIPKINRVISEVKNRLPEKTETSPQKEAKGHMIKKAEANFLKETKRHLPEKTEMNIRINAIRVKNLQTTTGQNLLPKSA